jgi:uncharacterized protein
VTRPLFVNVADVARHPGVRRVVSLRAPVSGLTGPAASVRGPVELDGVLEGIREGLLLHGSLRFEITAECSRCLAPVAEAVVVEVQEVFEERFAADDDGETYPIDHDEIDLEPLVRDAVLPELPPVPLCRPDCLGLCPVCGENRNETACDCTVDELDPRWSALRELKF